LLEAVFGWLPPRKLDPLCTAEFEFRFPFLQCWQQKLAETSSESSTKAGNVCPPFVLS